VTYPLDEALKWYMMIAAGSEQALTLASAITASRVGLVPIDQCWLLAEHAEDVDPTTVDGLITLAHGVLVAEPRSLYSPPRCVTSGSIALDWTETPACSLCGMRLTTPDAPTPVGVGRRSLHLWMTTSIAVCYVVVALYAWVVLSNEVEEGILRHVEHLSCAGPDPRPFTRCGGHIILPGVASPDVGAWFTLAVAVRGAG